MDASIRSRAEQLATEFAGQASTIEELSGLMRLMMKSALERMLNTEMDVHLGRRTLAVRYVSHDDSKAVIADLKKICTSATVVEAEQALECFAQAWDAKYPTISKMWFAKWADISTRFDYPPPRSRARSPRCACGTAARKAMAAAWPA